MNRSMPQIQRHFDYEAPFAGALRLSLGVAVVGALLASLAIAHDGAGSPVVATDTLARVVVLPPVEIVGKREVGTVQARLPASGERAAAAAALEVFDRPTTAKQ